ncbi:MAG: STAS domain-containing protein [Cyclobacteriaceae bacterium]|nr:STAS domain-containing protein [Cyclobacteriaceae bacterium]MCH8516411.1 STAS domain-containing protein [Cyclobacteriaceae bacterium]
MNYTISKEEPYSVFRLNEEKLNSIVAPKLKTELIQLQAEGVKNIIVDLKEVKYIDSSGLSSLLVGNRVFTENRGAYIICNPNEHVKKLIEISQLQKVLYIVPTEHEATEAVFMHEIENGLSEEEEDDK